MKSKQDILREEHELALEEFLSRGGHIQYVPSDHPTQQRIFIKHKKKSIKGKRK